MAVPAGLLATFLPPEWSEEAYTRSPPFVAEIESGKMYLVPRDRGVEVRLAAESSRLGLKKSPAHPGFLVPPSAVGGIREFGWLLRRSWRDDDLSALWALFHLGESRGWGRADISIMVIAAAAGLKPDECRESMRRLFHSHSGDDSTCGIGEYAMDRRLIELTIERRVRGFPTRTEEAVMAELCSSPGRSVSEVHEGISVQGVGIGAVYKVVERLKEQGYVYPARRFRVNKHGPMREVLSADCRNCFYGFTGPDACLLGTLRELEEMLQRDYGKTPTKRESSAMYMAVKAIPYGSRTSRKAIVSLQLMTEARRLSSEAPVSAVLKRIRDTYHIDLPTGTPSRQKRRIARLPLPSRNRKPAG